MTLRPWRRRDFLSWREVRLRNQAHLSPWEPTASGDWEPRHRRRAFLRLRAQLRHAARTEHMAPFVIDVDGSLAGGVNLGPIQRGVLSSTDIGYWIDGRYAGHGLGTIAVALAVRHAFEAAGLHRVHAAIRPENLASIRLVEKLGFRREALYRNYLDIDGAWRDHVGYALTIEDDLRALRAACGH